MRPPTAVFWSWRYFDDCIVVVVVVAVVLLFWWFRYLVVSSRLSGDGGVVEGKVTSMVTVLMMVTSLTR